MPAFQYIALDQNGKRIKGVAEADSARLVRAQLRDKQLTPLSVSSVSSSNKKEKSESTGFQIKRAKKMRPAELALVTRQMATLIEAGIPIDEVLSSVSSQTEKSQIKKILLGVRAKVLEGYPLAYGMAEFPAAFPELYRTTIEAGERTGKLSQVLEHLAEYTEKQHFIRKKIRQALIYPIMMTTVSLTIVVFLLIYVVPKIVNVFSQTNQTLPFATQVLISASSFIQHYGIYILLALIAFIFLWRQLLKRPKFLRSVHHVLLRVPVIGKTIKAINCARFGRTFGILNAAAVPVIDSMQSAASLVKPLPMRESIDGAIALVREGKPIHWTLQKTGFFPPMFVHLVASGESSGQLDSMLEKAASYLESDVEGLIDTSLTLFEPLMIIVMGGIVLYIVLAIMLPIFSLDQVS